MVTPFSKLQRVNSEENRKICGQDCRGIYTKRVKEARTRQMEKLIDEIDCSDLAIDRVFGVGVYENKMPKCRIIVARPSFVR
jgi:hypothetical protein